MWNNSNYVKQQIYQLRIGCALMCSTSELQCSSWGSVDCSVTLEGDGKCSKQEPLFGICSGKNNT
jgi:hypothetical protein